MQDTQETRDPSLGGGDGLQREMATQSQCSCRENSMDRGACLPPSGLYLPLLLPHTEAPALLLETLVIQTIGASAATFVAHASLLIWSGPHISESYVTL